MDPPGFVIKHFGPVKGRGVVARKTLKKGDFVCEYSGDLIDVKEAKVSLTFITTVPIVASLVHVYD